MKTALWVSWRRKRSMSEGEEEESVREVGNRQ
jgi:hypothetical protein